MSTRGKPATPGFDREARATTLLEYRTALVAAAELAAAVREHATDLVVARNALGRALDDLEQAERLADLIGLPRERGIDALLACADADLVRCWARYFAELAAAAPAAPVA